MELLTRTAVIAILTAALLAAAACKSGQSGSSESGSSGGSGAGASAAAGAFEGVIDMKGDMGGRATTMIYYIGKGKMRMETKVPDTPGADTILLWDYSTGKATSLMPARKMYMTTDMKSAAEELKKSQTTQGGYNFPKLTDTGKTETIAGHSCEHYLMGDDQSMDMCIAKGLGYFGSGGPSGNGMMGGVSLTQDMIAKAPEDWKKVLEGGAFPLKMTATKNGQAQFTMEVTSIEKKKVDDSMFSIPAGYQEFKMPSMPMPSMPMRSGPGH